MTTFATKPDILSELRDIFADLRHALDRETLPLEDAPSPPASAPRSAGAGRKPRA